MNKEKKKLRSISFSTLTDFNKCQWYFYLKNIERLFVDTGNMWTYYGSWMHKYIQAVLIGDMEPEIAAKRFIRSWFKFCGIYRKQLKEQYKRGDPKLLYKNPVRTIMNINSLMREKFGEFKVTKIEERLKENTEYEQEFKGFVDLIFETKDKIIIADLKSCSSHYMFNKYRDNYKEYQLTLYKHYLCLKHNFDPKKVETYFFTVARDPKIKKELEFVRITSGNKKIKNALNWMNSTLQIVKEENFKKNKSACDNFYGKSCPFKNTPQCP